MSPCLLAFLACLLVILNGCFNTPPPTGPPPDAVLTNAMSSARLAFERGLNAEAVVLYRQALDRAREMDDASAIADAAYNLAAALLQAGRYDQARDALLESEVETARAGGNTADVLLLQAKAAMLQGNTSEAASLAGHVLAGPPSRPTAAHRVQVHVLRGEVAAGRGEWGAAEEQVRLAREALGDVGDTVSPAVLAGVVGLRARIAGGRGNWAAAGQLYDRQAELLRQARLYPDMARALLAGGRSWKSAGNPVMAAPRLLSAARSAAAQGDAEAGRSILAEAADAAGQLKDPRMRMLVRALREEWGIPATRPAAAGG